MNNISFKRLNGSTKDQDLEAIEQLNGSTQELEVIQSVLASYLAPNSLEDEASEFFREIAALKKQNVHDTLIEIITGSQKYLQATKVKITYKDDYPEDISLYANKLHNIADAIEACWDIFSVDTRNSFINLANSFAQASSKFEGLQGFLLKLKLFLPSIYQHENLFRQYYDATLLIPKAVDNAVNLRKDKSTVLLENTANYLISKARELQSSRNSLLASMKHLGKNPEEQLAKNQAAMAWAEARLAEIRSKRNQK